MMAEGRPDQPAAPAALGLLERRPNRNKARLYLCDVIARKSRQARGSHRIQPDLTSAADMRAGRTDGSAPVGSTRCWLCCSNNLVAVHSLALENSPEPANNPESVRYIAVVDISATPCIVRSNHYTRSVEVMERVVVCRNALPNALDAR
jgi:hypothetical protein